MPFPHMGTVLFAILAFLIPIVLFVSAVLVHRHVVEQRLRKNSLSRISGLDPPLGSRDPALLWPETLSAKAGSHCSKSSNSSNSARLDEVVVIGRRPTSAAAAAAASEGCADSRSLDGSVMLHASSSSEGRASSEHCGSPLSSSGSSGRMVGGTQGKSMTLDAHHAAEHGTCGSSHPGSSNGSSHADIATQHCVNSVQQQQLCGQQQQQRAPAGADGMQGKETLRSVDLGAAAQAASSTVDVAAGHHTPGDSTPYHSFNSNASSSAEAIAQAQGQANNLLQKQEQQHRLSPAGAGAADAADVPRAADQRVDSGEAAAAAAFAVSASQPHVKLGGSTSCHTCSSIFDTDKGQSGTPDQQQASLQLQRRLLNASADSDVRCDVLRTTDQHPLLTPISSDTAAAAPATPNNSLAGQHTPSSVQPVFTAKFAVQQPPALPLPQLQQQEQQQAHWHQ